MNQRLEDQRRLENISLLSLVPPGVAFGDVWEPFRKELVTLEIDGFKLFEEGKEINHHVRLAMFKADAPQRCENLDHVSVTAHNICPRCPKQKNDLWDWKEDLKIDHHRKGLLEAIEKLKDLIPEEDYHKVLHKLGFHGSNNLFQGMTFDAFLQTVCEVYHLLFLGIIKFYFRATVRSLAPWERDALNFMIKDFPFPRGTPRVTFDVTSSSKNFSMSTMALVIKALPHLLPLFKANKKREALVKFWVNVDDVVQSIFAVPQLPENVPKIKENFKKIFETGKTLFPDTLEKRPQNIHNLAEFLEI